MPLPTSIVKEVASINEGYKKNGSKFRINTGWNKETNEIKLMLMYGRSSVYVQNKKYLGIEDGEDRRVMEDFMVGATMQLSADTFKLKVTGKAEEVTKSGPRFGILPK